MVDVGSLIAEARKNQKISQDELAKKLNVTRQAVSNWERNITLPDVTLLKSIAKELSLDVQVLMNNNPEEHKKKRKIKFILLTIIIILFILIITFIILITINKNKFNLYHISIDDKSADINGGILALSKDTNYLLIGNIEFVNESITLDEFSTIKIYQNKNTAVRLIVETSYKENISIQEDYGYNEYFPDDIDLNNIYMDITNEEGTMTFKLTFNEVITSDKLMYTKNESIGNEYKYTNPYEDVLSIETLLENGYSYNTKFNQYTKTEDEINWYYKQSMNDLVMEIDLDNYEIRGSYDVDKKILSVRIFDISKDEYKTDCDYFEDGRVESYIGDCNDVEEYQKILQNEYEKVYKK